MSLAAQTIGSFLDELGDRTPTPGGGAVASVVAALGAELGRMVVSFSVGKKSFAEHADAHEKALANLRGLARQSLDLAAADAEAYGELNALWKLPEDDPARQARWTDAVDGAIAAPRAVLSTAIDVLTCVESLQGNTSRMLKSDLAIAAILAEAAARAAVWNVRINLPLLTDEAAASTLEQDVRMTLDDVASRARAVEQACAAS